MDILSLQQYIVGGPKNKYFLVPGVSIYKKKKKKRNYRKGFSGWMQNKVCYLGNM